MNELMGTEAELEELEFVPKRRKKPQKSEEDDEGSAQDSDDTEIISVHIQVHVESSDDLFKLCGHAGVWQIFIFLIGSFFGFNCAIQNFIYLFIADTPDYYCQLPTELDPKLYPNETLKKLLIPKSSSGQFESCRRYRHEVVNSTFLTISNKTEECNNERIPVQYEMKDFAETIGSEWALVCKDAFWMSSVEACYMVGVLVGSILFGMMSDKHGRRQTILVSTFMFLIFSPAIALSTNYVTLLLFRFCLGMASPGVYSTAYVLVIEAIGSQHRGLAGSLYSIPYSVGYMLLPIIAYFVREWRVLQLTTASLTSLMIIVWWYVPESPRWLLLQGRVKEAEKLFREIAKVNGRTLPKDFHNLVEKVASNERESKIEVTCDQRCRKCMSAVFKLCHTPILRFRVFCMSIAFVAISLVYYGIAINPTNLGFDRYLFTFLCGLFEIPAELVIAMLIEQRGRRLVFSGFFFITGALLVISLWPPRGSAINIILLVAAQLFISGNSTLIYLYSSELFPTEIRGYCLGISSMVGRTGSIAVPYIVEIVGEEHHTYPTIIFGSAALIAAALTIFLPETSNKKLPETIEEVESQAR